MVQINFALREVNCKIVYYGPGMSGKTTNLEIVHKKAPEANKGELTSIATEGDRTLFFDFMPLDLGTIAGMRTRFQLYTVPGQVYYNSTRKLVLQGVDGIVFVADSSESKMEENLESLENLKNNLAEYGKDIRELPIVLQYNKRDLPDALTIDQLNEKLNHWGCPYFEAVAITGEGVFPTLKCLSGMVLETLNRDHRETTAAAPAARGALASNPGHSATAASGRFGVGIPPAPGSGPTNAAIRTGSSIQQMLATAPRPTSGPVGGGGGGGGGGSGGGGGGKTATAAGGKTAGGGKPAASPVPGPSTKPGGAKSWNRKVDASPLEPPVRARPKGAASRRVQIAETRRIPWAAIGLAALIAVAVCVVLVTAGFVKFPS